MKRIIWLISLILLTSVLPALAQEATPELTSEATASTAMEGWRPYYNNRVGFGLMLPAEWVARDYGTTIDINIDMDDPASTVMKILLSPVEFFEGGVIQGTPVPDLSLEDYAAIALNYELGAPGVFTLQNVEPFATEAGLEGYLARWDLEIVPLQESGAEATAEPNQLIPYRAYYFELAEPEIDGQQVRALELIASEPLLVDDATFDAVLDSLEVGKLSVDDEQFAGLQDAVSAYLDANDATITDALVEPQIIDGDYVRFTLSSGEQAEDDKAVGFARRVGEGWEVITVGTAITPEFFTENQIPPSLELVTSG